MPINNLQSETSEVSEEEIISESERNRRANVAHDEFVKRMVSSGVEIQDIFENLEEVIVEKTPVQ